MSKWKFYTNFDTLPRPAVIFSGLPGESRRTATQTEGLLEHCGLRFWSAKKRPPAVSFWQNNAMFIRERSGRNGSHSPRPAVIFSGLPGKSRRTATQSRRVVRTLRSRFQSAKKRPRAVALVVFQQCSIFPGRHQPSIFDDEKLNFCVRNVNRWVLFSIATGNGITSNYRLE